ncbi:MAG: DUF2961 domain-containing protein [Flavipsychrobacter sp.]|nr:DUF2961 domain-containing protein [Flavipsychrobacter sp.]
MFISVLTSKKFAALSCICLCLLACSQPRQPATYEPALFEMDEQRQARWSSPENPNGSKGSGGKENNGAKGHAWDSIPAGSTITLLDITESGIIQRIWITVRDQSPQMLRAMKLNMYWDGETEPAVSVPLGDFFGIGLGQKTAFENEFFANPEGRSFNCFIPMPFRKGAKITITNESNQDQQNIFYDIDFSTGSTWDERMLYFHAYWNRDTATKLSVDFSILPKLAGKGRFLGLNMGVATNQAYGTSWFGEGEVKIYLDGDTSHPTLNGTGMEDYIGTAWGQGKFINRYTGCPIADDALQQWAFYRFHVPDPIYFTKDIRVEIQSMGGYMTNEVAGMQERGVPLIPVTTDYGRDFKRFYKKDSVVLVDKNDRASWTNFYRSDDYSSTAYFYLDRPVNRLPALAPVADRVKALRSRKP